MTHNLIRSCGRFLRNAALCCATAGLLASGTAVPATAGFPFARFGIKDEQELGRQFDVLVRSRMPLVEDPEIKLYVRSVVERLASVLPPQPFLFTANVLLNSSMNAFAVPGGYVFAHTGLIMELEHESELAGVLAHELAHVTQRHVAGRIERAQVTSLLSLAGALAGAFLGGGSGKGGLIAGSAAAGQAAMLNYSRVDESEADEMGLQYLIAAGYNPRGLQGSFEKIRKKQWDSGITVPTYLSTHPDVGTRINEIHARIQGLPASVRRRPENDARFRRVQTLVRARYGDPALAARYFADAGPHDCLSLMGRAILAERRNRVQEAEKDFDLAMRCAPKDPLIRREAGSFHYNKGDARAERLLLEALTLDPDDAMAQYYYARLLNDRGDKVGAHRYFEKLLRYVPEDSEIHYHYGRSLGEAGDTFGAYLHLAYSALYRNDKRKTESWIKQAGTAARTPEQQSRLKKFEAVYAERRRHWK